MEYNFDRQENRRGTDSIKWDAEPECFPMWVADMDFATAPAVRRAVEERARHGIFGYTCLPEKWQDAIIGWWKNRHGFLIQKDWLMFCTGIVPAVTCCVKRLTNPGDSVVVQTPVYNMFFASVEDTGRHVLENPLRFTGSSYEMDFEDLEQKLADPLTTMMILCNPQNPSGKIWGKEELARIGELCAKYHVTVLSDEIHCDLADPGRSYTPFASLSEICCENSVTCISASKTFNIAGLQSAAVVVPNERLRAAVGHGLEVDGLTGLNCFAAIAAVAAFSEGGEWLDALRQYLYENKCRAYELFAELLPEARVVKPEATYLLWVDCSRFAPDTSRLCEYLKKEKKLFVSGGAAYRGNGAGFVRINIACPRAQMEEGIRLFCAGCKEYR